MVPSVVQRSSSFRFESTLTEPVRRYRSSDRTQVEKEKRRRPNDDVVLHYLAVFAAGCLFLSLSFSSRLHQDLRERGQCVGPRRLLVVVDDESRSPSEWCRWDCQRSQKNTIDSRGCADTVSSATVKHRLCGFGRLSQATTTRTFDGMFLLRYLSQLDLWKNVTLYRT
jgi:hypothetical protein